MMQKDNLVDFPKYVTTFVNLINNRLSFHGMLKEKPTAQKLPPCQLHVTVHSDTFSYCYDGIKLIEKTFSNKGIECKCSKFVSNADSKQKYSYEFVLKLKK
jgi:hypothetical protein